MSLDERFQKAAADIKKVGESGAKPEDLLEVYSLYKQATAGDVNIPRPDESDPRARGKWDGWNSKKGLTKDQAKEQYIAKVASIL